MSGDTDPAQREWFNENTKTKNQIEGYIKNKRGIIHHLDKLSGKIPDQDPNNPWNKKDWKKHIQKALNNISKKLKKLNKPLEQVLKEKGWDEKSINNLVKRLNDAGFRVPKYK